MEASIGIRFRVPPRDREGSTMAWPGVPVGESGQVVASSALTTGAPEAGDEAPPDLKAAYREAVTRYAADGSSASVRTLVDLERASLKQGSASEFRHLANTATSLGRDVRKGSSQALLGLCLVNLDLYGEHSRDVARLAIAHSRRAVERLAAMLADDTGDAEAVSWSADVLAVFAGRLRAAGSWATSERLFVRAMLIDGRNIAALMGRVGMYERANEPASAITMLERVIALQPDHAEARLRLGVNQRRIGRVDAALGTLTRCTGTANPEWVRAVAWQELAGQLAADGKTGDAVRALREAIAQLPADQHLRVLLASILDQQRHHREALDMVNSIVERSNRTGPSARFVYGEWPHEDLDAAQRRLDALRPKAMASLAAAAAKVKR
jgi:tetratricopeptide (TPR) repeat protein